MRAAAILIAVSCLLPMAAKAQPAAAPADCKLVKIDSLDMDVSDKALMIPTTINGKPMKLRLNLEASMSALTQATALNLDLSLRSLSNIMSFMAGQDNVQVLNYADVPQFQLGHLPAQKFRVAVLPPKANIDVAGEISGGTLSVYDYDLDVAHGKMGLFLPNHCPGQVVYWTRDTPGKVPFNARQMYDSNDPGFMRGTMTLDDKPVRVAFRATGPSYMGAGALYRVFGISTSDPRLVPSNQEAAGVKLDPPYDKVWSFSFKALSADGLTITNPQVYVLDQDPRYFSCRDDAHCYGGADLTLGLPVLSKLHIFVSNKEKMLYLTAADAH
jgi:hypothetical protein